MTALNRLVRTGVVDIERALVLHTASKLTIPPPGKTLLWSKAHPYPDGGRPALDLAFLVGNTVYRPCSRTGRFTKISCLRQNKQEYRVNNIPNLAVVSGKPA